MNHKKALAILAGVSMALTPVLATAQNVSVTRSVLTGLPYTLIYPAEMVATGGGDAPVTINHPDAPLQCEMSVVPVDDTDWSAETELSALDEAEIAASWSGPLPGFSVSSTGLVEYQDATALTYEGVSTDSAMGIPLTLVHTETVASGRGYILDCIFAADQAEQARPLVDFIIANFATRADADCCIGATVAPEEEQTSAQ